MTKLALLQAVLSGFLVVSCASFENHQGEKFPFGVQVLKATTPAATVIVSHGGGCRTSHEDAWADRFKQWGYNSVVIDHCSARGISPHTGVEPPPLAAADRINDAIAVAEWVKVQPWHKGRIALFGASRGGEAVLRAADPRLSRVRRGAEGLAEIDVYVALYPACSLFPRAPRGPLLILHGEEDDLAVFSNCEYATRSHEKLTIKTYPGAYHGFDIPGDDVMGSNRFLGAFVVRRYNAAAAEASFSDTRAFLEKHLKP